MREQCADGDFGAALAMIVQSICEFGDDRGNGRFEVEQAADDVEVALASLSTAARRADAARGAFRIAERKRDLGQISQAEYLDARRALTEAELNRNVTRATALEGLAALEFATGDAVHAPAPETTP